jgi:uroporphyrinogen decarboxylase
VKSRERVLQSMHFLQPDRVAVDLGGHRSSGIQAIAYARLRDYLGLPKRPPRVYDMPQQLAIIDDDVLDRFGVDCVELGRGFNEDEADWREWRLPDGTECLIPHWVQPVREGNAWVIKAADGTPLAVQREGMVYFDQVYFPLREDPGSKLDRLEAMLQLDMWDAVAAPPGPVPRDRGGARYLAEGARKLRERTDRAIVGLFGASLFEGGQQLFGMETYLVLLAKEPSLVERFLDQLVAVYQRRLEFFLKAVGPYIDILLFSDDYGTQTAPQISPRMFRQYFKPRHRQLWERAKQLAPVKILLHSCGSIRAFMPLTRSRPRQPRWSRPSSRRISGGRSFCGVEAAIPSTYFRTQPQQRFASMCSATLRSLLRAEALSFSRSTTFRSMCLQRML